MIGQFSELSSVIGSHILPGLSGKLSVLHVATDLIETDFNSYSFEHKIERFIYRVLTFTKDLSCYPSPVFLI